MEKGGKWEFEEGINFVVLWDVGRLKKFPRSVRRVNADSGIATANGRSPPQLASVIRSSPYVNRRSLPHTIIYREYRRGRGNYGGYEG